MSRLLNEQPLVLDEQKDGVAWIILNRPGKLNALNSQVWRLLDSLITRYCQSPSIDTLVITGNGKAFSAGDDIIEMHGFQGEEEAIDFFSKIYETIVDMINCDKLVVAIVNGIAVGGGGEILLLTDYNIALESAIIGFPESKIGLFPPILTTIGKHIVGWKRALHLSMNGEMLPAGKALELGIIDRVVDSMDEAEEVLQELRNSIPVITPRSIIRRTVFESKLDEVKDALMELARLTVSDKARRGMEEMIRKWRRQS